MNTHNVCFCGELKKITSKLSSDTHHVCFSGFYEVILPYHELLSIITQGVGGQNVKYYLMMTKPD